MEAWRNNLKKGSIVEVGHIPIFGTRQIWTRNIVLGKCDKFVWIYSLTGEFVGLFDINSSELAEVNTYTDPVEISFNPLLDIRALKIQRVLFINLNDWYNTLTKYETEKCIDAFKDELKQVQFHSFKYENFSKILDLKRNEIRWDGLFDIRIKNATFAELAMNGITILKLVQDETGDFIIPNLTYNNPLFLCLSPYSPIAIISDGDSATAKGIFMAYSFLGLKNMCHGDNRLIYKLNDKLISIMQGVCMECDSATTTLLINSGMIEL